MAYSAEQQRDLAVPGVAVTVGGGAMHRVTLRVVGCGGWVAAASMHGSRVIRHQGVLLRLLWVVQLWRSGCCRREAYDMALAQAGA